MSDLGLRHIQRERPDQPAGPRGDEERELRAVAALLHSLPDPEPEGDLAARVMARIEAGEARPRTLRGAFRRAAQPRFAAALAAGLSCLLLVTAVRDGRIGSGGVEPAVSPVRVASATHAKAGGGVPAFFQGGSATPLSAGLAPVLGGEETALDQQLDRQINYLLLDPEAFFTRLESVYARDRFMARLAERAARRGDSAQLAMRVRSADHPLADPLAEQFLRASLVEYVASR